MKITYDPIVLLLCASLLLSAPPAKAGRESEFITGIGTASLPEGKYQPLLLIWHVGRDLKKYFSWLEKIPGRLTAFLEPQLNPSHRPDDNIELGIGAGIQYRYPFTEKLAGYALGSTGPHYMTLVTSAQAHGFLFANTLGAGLYYLLRENSALNLGFRYRHLSNAGLIVPNGGVNAGFITLGYAVFF